MIGKLFVIGAMLMAGVSLAQPAAPPVENTDVTGTRPEPLRCISTDPPTGSHMGAKKICHTRLEWQQIRLGTQQGLRNLEDDQEAKAQRDLAAAGGR